MVGAFLGPWGWTDDKPSDNQRISPNEEPISEAIGIETQGDQTNEASGEKEETTDNHGIEIHDDWEVVSAFSPIENEQAELGNPVSVASCPDGRIAVSNPTKKCVLVFSRSGRYSKALFLPGARCEDRWFRPFNIAVTSQGHIYVTTLNHEYFVNVFDLDDKFIRCLEFGDVPCGHVYADHSDNIFFDTLISEFRMYSDNDGELLKRVLVKGYNSADNKFAVNRKGLIIAQVGIEYKELVVYDVEGTELFAIDHQDTNAVVSIDTDADNNIYILTSNRVSQYNSTGGDKRCIAKLNKRAKAMTISRNEELIVLAEDTVFVLKLKST